MPTGYTYKIYDGSAASLKEYALVCADAYLGHDFPNSITYSEVYSIGLKHETTIYDEIKSWSDAKKKKKFEAAKKMNISMYQDMIKENKEVYERYNSLLVQIKEWNVEGLDVLKEFMIKQIKTSIDMDCNLEGFETQIKFWNKLTVDEWYDSKLETAERTVNYYRENAEKERNRNKTTSMFVEILNKEFGTKFKTYK